MIATGSNEITKAYIGDTEIDKIYLGEYLVFEKTSPIDTPYITDGLVFLLDGIDKGDDVNVWTDLAGGITFPYTTHSSVDSTSVIMDGKGLLTGSGTINIGQTSGTIEACIYNANNKAGVIFIPTITDSLMFAVASAGVSYGIKSGSNQYNFTKPQTMTASFNSARALVNGVSYTTKVNNGWAPSSNYATIGGRNYGTQYFFTGNIYAIRIYNRQLSQDEMLYNQQIDNDRFNLGLII